MLAGSGEDESALRRLAQTHDPGAVVFACFVQPTELAQYYCAADVYESTVPKRSRTASR